MGVKRTTALLAALIGLAVAPSAGTGQAQESGASGEQARPGALFASHEPLELTLEADFSQLEEDREEDSPERPAAVFLSRPNAEPLRIDAQVRTRGKFRLQRRTCQLPNLRLNFPKKQLEGTVLEGQDKLKLVGYCRDRDDFEQNVLEEYAVYRAYNLVTDVSFRVRLARITYRDTSGKREPITRYGFLLEDDDALAERVGGKRVEAAAVPPVSFDAEAATMMALFQYMVGNTDWSMVQFHNSELVQLPDGKLVPVPYDFDFSGVVNAPYAAPDPSLGTRSVRERVYRGFCRAEVDMKKAYDAFGVWREAFDGLFRGQQGLDPENAERAVEYLDDFYEVIGSERRAGVAIERACRPLPSE